MGLFHTRTGYGRLQSYVFDRALRRLVAEVFRINGTGPEMDIDTCSATLIAVVQGLALSRASGFQGSVASSRQVLNILLGLEPAAHGARAQGT